MPITAKIIKDSISPNGKRITTFELEFPRWILAEVNTHRMLSKNAASSRAVPVESSLAMIEADPAMPIHWGSNNAGMVSKAELDDLRKDAAKGTWLAACASAVSHARVLSDKVGINGHKQWVNRLVENFSYTKQVLTGTEYANLFWLRDHPDAQPEFKDLAHKAKLAYDESVPTLLQPGEWHLPYVDFVDGKYFVSGEEVDLQTAKEVSASCCAQVSYRKLDESIEKARKIFGMLNLTSKEQPPHFSPAEHQATPMQPITSYYRADWELGVTHMTRNGDLWSGNFCGWIQYRQVMMQVNGIECMG